MPKVVKSATSTEKNGLVYGDIRGHIFALDPSASATLFWTDEDGANWASPALPATFACFQCHEGKDAAWVEQNAGAIH